MDKNLLIVFAKNKLYGKVKTRLAKTIGEANAFKVYERLYHITEEQSVAVLNADIQVYYSHHIDSKAWKAFPKYIQKGETLGERMKNAFEGGFLAGYSNIIGIGADLPEIRSEIIENAFEQLTNYDFVFGPAEDGGYYLVGMNAPEGMHVFENKPWSTVELMELTEAEIQLKGKKLCKLDMLNDIDNIDDLERSCIGNEFSKEITAGRNVL